jgi:hypothetical protein
MYQTACKMLETAKVSIADTTWGSDEPKPTPRADAVRERYKVARFKAVERGVRYREIFTCTPGKLLRVKEAARRAANAEYESRVIQQNTGAHPIIDFIVADVRYVLLSHVASHRDEGNRFLWIESKAIAKVFQEWFDDCWQSAAPFSQSSWRPRPTTARASRTK